MARAVHYFLVSLARADPEGETISPSSSTPSAERNPRTAGALATSSSDRHKGPQIRRGFVLGIFAIATIIIVVLSLILSGTLTPTRIGETSTTFRPSWANANSSVDSLNGSGWNLVLALGYDSPISLTVGIENFTGTCPLAPLSASPTPTTLTIPAFTGSLSSGSSPFWLLAFEQSTTAEVYLVGIVGGTTLPIGVGTASCLDLTTADIPIPTESLDSSTAIQIAAAAGGSDYLAAHPTALLEMTLTGGLPGGPPLDPGAFWAFVYSTCNPFGIENPSGNQPARDIQVSALNGTVLAVGNTSVDCQPSFGSIALGSALNLGNVNTYGPQPSNVPGECSAGAYCYQIPFVVTIYNLTASELQLKITTNTGLLVSIVAFYLYGNSSSQGYLTGGVGANPSGLWAEGQGTMTPNSTLAGGDSIWIDVSPLDPIGLEYQFTAMGYGPFSGSVSTTLP